MTSVEAAIFCRETEYCGDLLVFLKDFVELSTKVILRSEHCVGGGIPQHSLCSYASGAQIGIYFHSQTTEKMAPPCMARQDLVCMFYDIILFSNWLNRDVRDLVRFRFCVQFVRHGSSAPENEQVTEQIFRLRSWFTNFQEAQSGAALFRETYRWV